VPAEPESTYMSDERISQLTNNLQRVLDESIAFLIRKADYARTDRLWPADTSVFTTNPLSLAYGACGPALFLFASGRLEEVPKVSAWMGERALNSQEYPPGLFLGSAGIACVSAHIGLPAGIQSYLHRGGGFAGSRRLGTG
jgi:hypothetical protein